MVVIKTSFTLEELKIREDYYQSVTKKAEDDIRRDSTQADAVTFTLLTGSLVLSIGSVSNLIENFHLVNLPLVIVGWSFFIVGIFSHLISYSFARKNTLELLKNIYEWRTSGYAKEVFQTDTKFEKHVYLSNLITRISLVIGMLLISIFISGNLLMLNEDSRLHIETKAPDNRIQPFSEKPTVSPQASSGVSEISAPPKQTK